MRVDVATILRAAGLEVVLVPGWETAGRDLDRVLGVVAHHTATGPNWTDEAVARMLRNGRPDLAGPLAQVGLDRRGRYWVVASGRANHNGYGTWGNSSLGIEAMNSGTGEPWPAVQVDAYVRGAAALLKAHGLGADRFLAHRETDPRRKIDPAGLNMADLRTRVAAVLGGQSQEDPLMAVIDAAALERNAAAAALYGAGTYREVHEKAKTPEGVPTLALRVDRVDRLVRAILPLVKDLAAQAGPRHAAALAAVEAAADETQETVQDVKVAVEALLADASDPA